MKRVKPTYIYTYIERERDRSFHREVDKNCALLGCYAAWSGNSLPTFPDNLSFPSSVLKKMGMTGCPETSVRNHHYALRNILEERISQVFKVFVYTGIRGPTIICSVRVLSNTAHRIAGTETMTKLTKDILRWNNPLSSKSSRNSKAVFEERWLRNAKRSVQTLTTQNKLQRMARSRFTLETTSSTASFMWLCDIFYVNRNRSNVESFSTALSAVPGTTSSHTRQRFPLYQAQCRVSLDSASHCTRHNVESLSTALPAISGPMSSQSRQPFPLYQAECRAPIDKLLYIALCRFSRICVWTLKTGDFL
jgi:hypothetical protein